MDLAGFSGQIWMARYFSNLRHSLVNWGCHVPTGSGQLGLLCSIHMEKTIISKLWFKKVFKFGLWYFKLHRIWTGTSINLLVLDSLQLLFKFWLADKHNKTVMLDSRSQFDWKLKWGEGWCLTGKFYIQNMADYRFEGCQMILIPQMWNPTSCNQLIL